MNKEINRNLVFLAHNVKNFNGILQHLRQRDIISQNEKEEIESEKTTLAKYERLLNLVERKEVPLKTFVEILRKTDNEECANVIEGIPRPVLQLNFGQPKILKSRWWPANKPLTKSLHKRKMGNKLLIAELHERILRDENRMVVICESADASKLTGLGGVGKTLTANWYAHDYENEYEHIVWIDCGEDSLLLSFKKLARDLKIDDRSEFADLEDYATKSYERLEEFKCLWIFDNAEEYQGDEGIKEVLPKCKENFYCLITSRSRDWGSKNIGHGMISRLELNIFGETESLEFFKENLKREIYYSNYQLKELCALLGNLPLALQLAVATLNNGKMNLQNYIEETPSKDLQNVADTKCCQFDDYEKTINGNIKISLGLILKEENGQTAKEILMIFGYIRPDNVQSKFLMKIMKVELNVLEEAIDLLEKYSLLTKTGTVQESPANDGIINSLFGRNKDKLEMSLLSTHRLLQQVIRHNGRKTEKDTLRKIFGCNGFLDYKLIPFTKYADEQIRKEFPKIKLELLAQKQLRRLLWEKRFEESVQLARFIDKEINTKTTKFNYAVCLQKNEELEEAVNILNSIFLRHKAKENKLTKPLSKLLHYIIEHKLTIYFEEEGILDLKTKPKETQIGDFLLYLYLRLGKQEEALKIMQQIKSLEQIINILSLTEIPNYSLTVNRDKIDLNMDGSTKEVEIKHSSFDISILPQTIQKLTLDEAEVVVSAKMEFPNLKCLKVCWMSSSCLFNFRSVPLTSIHFYYTKDVNVDLIPQSVTTVKIENHYTRVFGKLRSLKKLILWGFSMEGMDDVLNRFHPQQLVVWKSCAPQELAKLMKKKIKAMAVGSFHCREEDFNNLILSKHVDRKSNCYLVERGKGTAIEWEEFQKLLELPL